MEMNKKSGSYDVLPQKEGNANIQIDQDVIQTCEDIRGMEEGRISMVHPNNTGAQGDNAMKIMEIELAEMLDDGPAENCCTRGIEKIQNTLHKWFTKYKSCLWSSTKVLLLALFVVYFVVALKYDVNNAISLIVLTSCVILCVMYALIRDHFGDKVYRVCIRPIRRFIVQHYNIVDGELSGIVVLVLLIIWIVVDTSKNPTNMLSLVGLVTIILFCFVFSKHPSKIRWRPVIWGLVIQFCLAIIILRTQWGFDAFTYFGEEVRVFLDYTDAGTTFVFGPQYYLHRFAFKVLPIMLFLGSILALLYHVGVMQVVIGKLAWFLQFTMGSSATESMNSAGNVFLSIAEAPLMVAPYIKKMTLSELHAVATGGYATVSGSVMGAAIAFGISPSYLITASAMSAPASLAISKLFYPETEKSPSDKKSIQISIPKHQNVLDAISSGGLAAVPLCVSVATNFIVFLAILAFLNAFLSWAGGMIGYPELSFEVICSWMFMPVAFLMGVDWEDCAIVAELIGMKIVTSVLVSYDKLSLIVANRELGLTPTISPRSELIATYALCGFSHLAGIGMTLGTLVGLCPERKRDINAIVVRAMIAGNCANFMTACIAGILYQEKMAIIPVIANIIFNATAVSDNQGLTTVM
ncbi:solute carrier family 28 member 3-like [Saccoglossus kowalevskii]